ncbi:hypothetical protein AURDEDRAFT_165328 [Auricularia subglabra TFB-10046 SS5]|nr:hypothetical protein AURDEDRAFT_165328 [Auricularia subglabra TFB-10046 SS5]
MPPRRGDGEAADRVISVHLVQELAAHDLPDPHVRAEKRTALTAPPRAMRTASLEGGAQRQSPTVASTTSAPSGKNAAQSTPDVCPGSAPSRFASVRTTIFEHKVCEGDYECPTGGR